MFPFLGSFFTTHCSEKWEKRKTAVVENRAGKGRTCFLQNELTLLKPFKVLENHEMLLKQQQYKNKHQESCILEGNWGEANTKNNGLFFISSCANVKTANFGYSRISILLSDKWLKPIHCNFVIGEGNTVVCLNKKYFKVWKQWFRSYW